MSCSKLRVTNALPLPFLLLLPCAHQRKIFLAATGYDLRFANSTFLPERLSCAYAWLTVFFVSIVSFEIAGGAVTINLYPEKSVCQNFLRAAAPHQVLRAPTFNNPFIGARCTTLYSIKLRCYICVIATVPKPSKRGHRRIITRVLFIMDLR